MKKILTILMLFMAGDAICSHTYYPGSVCLGFSRVPRPTSSGVTNVIIRTGCHNNNRIPSLSDIPRSSGDTVWLNYYFAATGSSTGAMPKEKQDLIDSHERNLATLLNVAELKRKNAIDSTGQYKNASNKNKSRRLKLIDARLKDSIASLGISLDRMIYAIENGELSE